MTAKTKGVHTQTLIPLGILDLLSKCPRTKKLNAIAKSVTKGLIAKYNIYIYLVLRGPRGSKNTVLKGNSGKALVDYRGIFTALDIGKRALSMLSGNNTRPAFCNKGDPPGVGVPFWGRCAGIGDTFYLNSLNTHGDILRQKECE